MAAQLESVDFANSVDIQSLSHYLDIGQAPSRAMDGKTEAKLNAKNMMARCVGPQSPRSRGVRGLGWAWDMATAEARTPAGAYKKHGKMRAVMLKQQDDYFRKIVDTYDACDYACPHCAAEAESECFDHEGNPWGPTCNSRLVKYAAHQLVGGNDLGRRAQASEALSELQDIMEGDDDGTANYHFRRALAQMNNRPGSKADY